MKIKQDSCESVLEWHVLWLLYVREISVHQTADSFLLLAGWNCEKHSDRKAGPGRSKEAKLPALLSHVYAS